MPSTAPCAWGFRPLSRNVDLSFQSSTPTARAFRTDRKKNSVFVVRCGPWNPSHRHRGSSICSRGDNTFNVCVKAGTSVYQNHVMSSVCTPRKGRQQGPLDLESLRTCNTGRPQKVTMVRSTPPDENMQTRLRSSVGWHCEVAQVACWEVKMF
jgi:hypothetical protein